MDSGLDGSIGTLILPISLWSPELMLSQRDLPTLGQAMQIDAPQDLEVITFIKEACKVFMPFAMVDWL